MEVSRQLALQIFGLENNFTQDELNKRFINLCNLLHPDNGGDEKLFEFVKTCMNTLENNCTQILNKNTTDKNVGSVYLLTLYEHPHRRKELNEYASKYDILYIWCAAKISIIPCKNKKLQEIIFYEMAQDYKEFKLMGFLNFRAQIQMPEAFMKFKTFNVRVEFMEETYEFNLSMKKPYHTIKCHDWLEFSPCIDLSFE